MPHESRRNHTLLSSTLAFRCSRALTPQPDPQDAQTQLVSQAELSRWEAQHATEHGQRDALPGRGANGPPQYR
jgi:hypothetical protein